MIWIPYLAVAAYWAWCRSQKELVILELIGFGIWAMLLAQADASHTYGYSKPKSSSPYIPISVSIEAYKIEKV